MLKKLSVLFIICLISLPAFSYVVKKGETLAIIVKRYYNIPAFGPNGGIARIIKYNPHIKNPNIIPPGTLIRLNKSLLKPDIVDNYELSQEEVLEDEVEFGAAPNDEAGQELNPYIEIEKYNETNTRALKGKTEDKINFILNFQFNNLNAKDRATFNTFSINTSSETDIGIEYSKYISDKTNIIGGVSLNQFSMSEVTSITPNIDRVNKTQAALSLAAQYNFTEANFIGFSVNYKPHYYLNLNSLGRLQLEHAPSSSFGLDTENQFYTNRDFVIGLNAGFEYITNPQYTGTGSTSGLAFNFGFIFQQEFKSNDKLRVKFNYSQTNLDTSSYNLIDNVLGINLLYSLPY